MTVSCDASSSDVHGRMLALRAVVTRLVTRHPVAKWYDRLLTRSFHAGGQPGRALVEARSRCPWAITSDRSCPPVVAWMWHASDGQHLILSALYLGMLAAHWPFDLLKH
jgi:hypothetical protein